VRRLLGAVALSLALALAASPALGQSPGKTTSHARRPMFHLTEVPPSEEPFGTWVDQWLSQPNMFGDWSGLRTAMGRLGIVPTVSWVTNVLGNPIGGVDQALREFDNLAVELDVDLATLIGAPGTKFHIGLSQRSGTNLSAIDIGNVFQVAEVCCGATYRLVDVFLEQPLFDDRLNVRAGRISAGDEFMTSPLYWLFVNAYINGNPGGIFLNAPGMTAYPVATWGVRVRAVPLPSLYVMAGAFNGDPTLGDNDKHGVDWTMRGPLFAIAEVGYQYNQGAGATGLPGSVKLGAYYNGGPFTEFLGGAGDSPPPTVQGNAGWYLLADQMLYRPGGPSSLTGLTAFFSFLMAPAASISTMPVFVNGGLVYRGLLPSRPNDVAGFGVIYGSFSSDLRESQRLARQAGVAATIQDYELVFEWNYAIQIARWLVLQPDVQYVVRPDGSSAIPNALVVGFQLSVNF
jgi:porin